MISYKYPPAPEVSDSEENKHHPNYKIDKDAFVMDTINLMSIEVNKRKNALIKFILEQTK